jgi:hypothetical protein
VKEGQAVQPYVQPPQHATIPTGAKFQMGDKELSVVDSTETAGKFNYRLRAPDGSQMDMTDQQLDELGAVLKVSSLRVANQVIYNCAVQVDLQPGLALEPDALEHSMKFCLEATKPSEAVHVSVDHIYAEVEGEGQFLHLVGRANCGVTFPADEFDREKFESTLISQLADKLKQGDFPAADIKVVSLDKRVASNKCIVATARSGATLAFLAREFGLGPARMAKNCIGFEKIGDSFQAPPMLNVQIKLLASKIAQEMVVDENDVHFVGDPASSDGARVEIMEGLHGELKYVPTKRPGFFWSIKAGDQIIADGQAETQVQAETDVGLAMPRIKSEMASEAKGASEKEASLKWELIGKFGPIARIEKLARVGSTQEVRVETKSGKTIWASIENNKVVDSFAL